MSLYETLSMFRDQAPGWTLLVWLVMALSMQMVLAFFTLVAIKANDEVVLSASFIKVLWAWNKFFVYNYRLDFGLLL